MAEKEQTLAAQFNTDVLSKVNATATHIELFVHGQSFAFSRAELPVALGRDEQRCQIVVDKPQVSRNHCIIEFHENQIGLTDTSTNGTFVQIGQSQSFAIRDKFYPLMGQGAIKLGGQIELDDPDIILFRTYTIG